MNNENNLYCFLYLQFFKGMGKDMFSDRSIHNNDLHKHYFQQFSEVATNTIYVLLNNNFFNIYLVLYSSPSPIYSLDDVDRDTEQFKLTSNRRGNPKRRFNAIIEGSRIGRGINIE